MFLKPLLAKNQIINYNFVPLQKTSDYKCVPLFKHAQNSLSLHSCCGVAYSSNRLSEEPSLKLLNLRKKIYITYMYVLFLGKYRKRSYGFV